MTGVSVKADTQIKLYKKMLCVGNIIFLNSEKSLIIVSGKNDFIRK